MLCHRGQQKLLQLHHFGDLPPVEHAAHQHQNGKRVLLERFHRAAPQPFQQLCRTKGGQQDPRIPLNDLQCRIVIPARLVGSQGVEILQLCLIPRPVPLPAGILLLWCQPGKQPLGTLLEHVMEPEGLSVRQTGHKGVLLGQGPQDLRCVRHFSHGLCHFHSEFIRKPYHGKEFLHFGRQVFQHRRREHGINVRVLTQQDAPFSQGVEVQVDGGEPPLAGAQKAIHLCFGQVHAAAVGVVGKLGMVEPQLFLANAVQAVPQPEDLLFGQKVVPACHDQVNVLRQAICQSAQKLRRFFVL